MHVHVCVCKDKSENICAETYVHTHTTATRRSQLGMSVLLSNDLIVQLYSIIQSNGVCFSVCVQYAWCPLMVQAQNLFDIPTLSHCMPSSTYGCILR